MPDPDGLAALLLVIGPIAGAIAASHPALFPVWAADRGEQLRIVRGHRVAWRVLNAGFFLATVSTAAGLAVLTVALDADPRRMAALVAVTVAYAVGGALWCTVVAVRAQTMPLIADLDASGRTSEPAETLLGGALGGLFGAFTVSTCVALLGLGLSLTVLGGVALPIAVLVVVIPAVVLVAFAATGDAVPAVLYLPTMLIGAARLAGWT